MAPSLMRLEIDVPRLQTLCSVLFALCLLAAPAAGADYGLGAIRALSPVADAGILEGLPAENSGADVAMLAGYSPSATPDDVPPGAARLLLQFDVAAIPAGAVINSATLMLRLVSSWDVPGEEAICMVQRVVDPWQEETVTWANAPAVGERSGWARVPHAQWGWYGFDVTLLVRGWQRDDYANHGLMVSGDEARPNWRGFSSREGDYAPQLVINYEPPTPTPTLTPSTTPSPTATPSGWATLPPTLPPPTATPTLTILLLPLIMSR